MWTNKSSSDQIEINEVAQNFTNDQSQIPDEENRSQEQNFPENRNMRNHFVEILIRHREPEPAFKYI